MKEHITKREIFLRLQAIREKYQYDADALYPREELLDLETGVLMDCRQEN